MINRYREYLDFLDSKLEKMFMEQKPFIKCKKGCDLCCSEGEYPLSELEYVNIMFYYNELPVEIKSRVDEQIAELLKSPRQKMYKCPFLVDKACSVYPARAIICRTFGLLSFDENDKRKAPFCMTMGFNYSNVYDPESKLLVKKADDGTEPVAYNISRLFLRSKIFEKKYSIFFGEDKALIDWLKEETFDFMQ